MNAIVVQIEDVGNHYSRDITSRNRSLATRRRLPFIVVEQETTAFRIAREQFRGDSPYDIAFIVAPTAVLDFCAATRCRSCDFVAVPSGYVVKNTQEGLLELAIRTGQAQDVERKEEKESCAVVASPSENRLKKSTKRRAKKEKEATQDERYGETRQA